MQARVETTIIESNQIKTGEYHEREDDGDNFDLFNDPQTGETNDLNASKQMNAP